MIYFILNWISYSSLPSSNLPFLIATKLSDSQAQLCPHYSVAAYDSMAVASWVWGQSTRDMAPDYIPSLAPPTAFTYASLDPSCELNILYADCLQCAGQLKTVCFITKILCEKVLFFPLYRWRESWHYGESAFHKVTLIVSGRAELQTQSL